MVLEEARVERSDDRQVEAVEPEHRLVAVVRVVVERPRRREHQVAGVHVACIAIDGRPHAAAFEDEADGRRRVPVGGRPLVRTERLDGTPEGRRREGCAVEARVRQRQHAALAATLDRDEISRPRRQCPQRLAFPKPWDCGGHRCAGEQRSRLRPKWLQVDRPEVCVERVEPSLDVAVDAHVATSIS